MFTSGYLHENSWWIVPVCIFILEIVFEFAEVMIFAVYSKLLLQQTNSVLERKTIKPILRRLGKRQDDRKMAMLGKWGQELSIVGISFTILAATTESMEIDTVITMLLITIVAYILTWLLALIVEPLMSKKNWYYKLSGAAPLFFGFIAVGLSLTLFS